MRLTRLIVLVLPALALALATAWPSGADAQEPVQPNYSLPWEGGTVWRYMYGPHGASDPTPSALDFQPPDSGGRVCETFVSGFWAVAVADGRATVLPNAVEVDHGNGFRTGYYHLADKQVKTGDEVKSGQRLGRPACCPDGGTGETCWSSEPHLHFYAMSGGSRRPIRGVNIGGWLVDNDGCLARPDRRACPGASLISNAPRVGESPAQPVDITVAMDVSGSMAWAADGGEQLQMVAPYLRAASDGQNVTLVAFNSHSSVLTAGDGKRPLDALVDATEEVEADGNTDLIAGLNRACQEMQARGPEPRQALVLISDGFHNGARLHDPQKCFAERGWPVFAYGLGRANEPLLTRLATSTGGDYRPASEIFDPACELERIRTVLSGGAYAACTRFLLMPGERLALPLDVPPEQKQAALVVNSVALTGDEGATVRAAMRMPGGKPLAADAALAHEADAAGERYAIASPATGRWEAVISGKDLPPAGILIDVSFGTSATGFPIFGLPSETPTPTPDAVEESPLASPTAEEEAPGDTATVSPSPSPTAKATAVPRPTPTPSPRETPVR